MISIASNFYFVSFSIHKLLDKQDSLQVYTGKIPVKPLTDVVTRWWSTYQMCERLLYLKQALGSMSGGGDLPMQLLLSERDWTDIKSVVTILKPFRTSQQFLEGEKYVTSCYVLPTVFLCREGLRKGNTNDAPKSIRKLSQTLNKDFDIRWGCESDSVFTGEVRRGYKNRQVGIHPAFIISTFLHPSLKLFAAMGMDDESKARVDEEVIKLMMKHNTVEDDVDNHENRTDNDDGDIVDSDDESPLDKILRLNAAAAKTAHNEPTADKKATCERELLDYKNLKPKVPTNGKQNPDALEWWKRNESKYPHLAALAKKYLSIQATSAPSERIFSKAGRIISDLWTRLNPGIAGKLLYVSENWNWFVAQLTSNKSDQEQNE